MLVAAACGGDDDGAAGDGESTVVRLAASSTADAYIPQYRSPELFGDIFGISTDDHLTQFESHATASQVLLAGEADIGGGSLDQMLQLIQEGQEFQAFCPVQKDSTEHIAGRTEAITSLEQVTDPNIRVAIDSPGGLINFIMNLVFVERGIDITTDELQNVSVLEDGGLRLSALASGDVDVGSVDLFEIADLREQIGDDAVTTLSVVAEDTEFIANLTWAPTAWIEENPEAAARYCATVLFSNRTLASDFEQYQEVLNQFIEGGVPEEVARTNWEFAREHEVWPYNTDVINEDVLQTQIQVAVDSGLLDEEILDLTFDEMVNTEIMDMAMEIVGGPVDAQDVNEGNIPEPSV